ncbi:ribose-5-phosphate isomerase RpiA [soil metagenome]
MADANVSSGHGAPDPFAEAAIARVDSGMVVGLGTGRAAARGVRALGKRAAAEKLELTCVATSAATAELARALGLRVVEFNHVSRIDVLFDGADEVDGELNMIKGGGAAMTRERIVAHACRAAGGVCIYMIDESKVSARLGAQRALPIEVIPFAQAYVLRELERLSVLPGGSGDGVRRIQPGGAPLLTENGGRVLDVRIPETVNICALAAALDSCAGVIDHGLFFEECDELIIELQSGLKVTRRGG